jgi:hypothetical protein
LGGQPIKVINQICKNLFKSLKLSKFTPSTAQQAAANSDGWLKSYGQKTFFFGQKWPKMLFFATII